LTEAALMLLGRRCLIACLHKSQGHRQLRLVCRSDMFAARFDDIGRRMSVSSSHPDAS